MSNYLIDKKDRFFIAGAKGMVGSAVSRALYQAGYKNQLTPSKNELDLRDNNQVSNWFSVNRPDIVILAAAKVGGIYANSKYPVDFLLDNLKIQNNVIENSFLSGCRRLLFLGSSCIYPKFAEQPIQEDALLTGSLEPTNEYYAIAKIAGIKLCAALHLQHGFDAISLMPTNLYGVGDNYHPQNSHVIPALISRLHKAKIEKQSFITCWGSGSPLREFLHSDDLGNACLFALEKWQISAPETPLDINKNPLFFLNVGSGKDLSIKKLVELLSSIIGYNGKIYWDCTKADGTPKKQLNICHMNRLGWEAKIELSEGLQMAYKDFLTRLNKGTLRC